MLASAVLNPNEALSTFLRISQVPENLQELTLARRINGVFGLRVAHLELLHSVIEIQADGGYQPLVLGAPAIGVKISSTGESQKLTTNCVRPNLAERAISALRQVGPLDAEVFIHNLRPEILIPKLRGSHWDNWAMGKTGLSPAELLADRRESTKEKTLTLIKELESHQKIKQFKNILFLGCGDGCDVEAFISYAGSKIYGAKITAIDQSELALQQAQKLNNKHPAAVKLDFMQLDFKNSFSLSSRGPFDLVIAVGIFDRETLYFDEGRQLATHLRMIMSKDAVLATSAYGYELFEKKNYEDFGYSVMQSCIPANLFKTGYPILYLMRNTDQVIKCSEDYAAARSSRLWK